MLSTPGFREVFTRNGRILRKGEICYRKALADTLEKVAKNGANVFYEGDIADELVKAVHAADGLLAKEDLVNYRPVVEPALEGTYRGRRVLTPNAPTSGPSLLSVLNILEGFNMTSPSNTTTGSSPPALDYHRIVEAFKHGFAQRTMLGDPRFVDVANDIKSIIGKNTAKERRGRIDDVSN